MFNLDSNDAKADRFYNYAKSLAILRENFMNYRNSAARIDKTDEIRKQIDNAISVLVKQVQE